MTALHRFGVLKLLVLGASRQIVAGRHRESIRNQVGAAQNQDDARSQVRANYPGDDREGGHRAIDAAIDPISQIALLGAGREPLVNGLSGMFVFHARQGAEQLRVLRLPTVRGITQASF